MRPGRYLMFSCCVLMISVSFLPPMSSSNTHMVTRGSKCASRAALPPTILAMAEPLVGGGAQKMEEWRYEGGVVEGEGSVSHLRILQQPTRLFTSHLPCPPTPKPKQLFKQGAFKAPFLWQTGAGAGPGRGQERFGHHLSYGVGTEDSSRGRRGTRGYFLPTVCLLPTYAPVYLGDPPSSPHPLIEPLTSFQSLKCRLSCPSWCRFSA